MSRIIKSLIPLFFAILFALNLFAEGKQVSDTSPEHIRLLIKQLGAADFADREHATKELLRLGYYARDEVKKAIDQKDPEVRMRLKNIWKKIQWILFPGAGEDVSKLLAKLKPNKEKSKQWDEITKKYGPGIMVLFIQLENMPGYSRHAQSGLVSLLNTSEPEKIADFIEKSPDKEKIVKMLGSLSKNKLKLAESQNLQVVLSRIGLKEESVMTAASAWRIGSSAKIAENILGYCKDPDFTAIIFTKAREQLDGAETSLSNDWKICFFAKVAKDINRKDLIKTLLTDLDYNITNNTAIIYLAEILLSMSLPQETIEVLSGTHSPRSIYLRAIAYHNTGDKKTSLQLMDLLSSKLTSESICFSVAEEMNKFKDTRAVNLWQKILEMDPNDSVYDSNARFRLGSFYESRGVYGKAADLFEKGLLKMEGALLMTDHGQTKTGISAEKSIKGRIYRLREQEKGGASVWFKAVMAMQNKENDKALEGFRNFIANNPDYPWAYYNMAIILEGQGDTDKAIAFLDKAIKFVKKDETSLKIDFIIKKSYFFSGKEKYDQAIMQLNQALDLDPENIDVASTLAMNTYYSKDYKKCAELFAKNYLLDPDDLYTQLWMYICLRKIKDDPVPEFAKFAKKIEGNEWPVPIIKYYAGAISLEQCLKATTDADKKRENEKKCEAYYFIGELMMLNDRKKEAIEYFNKSIKCNLSDFREHKASLQRLKELK